MILAPDYGDPARIWPDAGGRVRARAVGGRGETQLDLAGPRRVPVFRGAPDLCRARPERRAEARGAAGTGVWPRLPCGGRRAAAAR